MGYETSGTARWSRRSGTRNKTLEAVMMFGIFSIFRNGWMGKQCSGSTLRIAGCRFMVGLGGWLTLSVADGGSRERKRRGAAPDLDNRRISDESGK